MLTVTEPVESLRTQKLSLVDPANAELAQRLGLPGGELIRIFCLGLEQAKDADGQRPVLVSTDDVDRMGDIVEPDGMDLGNYRKNPVILWAHDYTLPPIGSSLWIRRQEHGLLAKPRWASTEFAQQIKLLYDEGHLRAWSIGFLVKEWEPIVAKDKDGQERTTGYRYTKSELLEFSAVPVPANPEALSEAMAKGLTVGKALREQLVPTKRNSVGYTSTAVPGDPLHRTQQQIDNATAPVAAACDVCAALREQVEALRVERDDAKNANDRFAQAVVELNTKIAALEAQLAAATEELTKIKDTGNQAIRIDIARIKAQGAEAVIKVDGVELTRQELISLVRETVDGLIRKRAGVVSA